ncbi:MAG: hypothetical protein M3246_09210 [Actinomycetota bacterium]|nr:hypothetical protein [Actinomycetota bacterium]
MQSPVGHTVLVALPPGECLDRLEAHMLRWGFELAGLEENRVAFSRNKGPDPALGCILLFLFVIPGIIYFILAEGETVYTTVMSSLQMMAERA